MRLALALVVIGLHGQTAFPLRPLEKPSSLLEGIDRGGRPWRVWLSESPALFPARQRMGDLDGDGQQDFLVERPLPGLGACVGRAEIVVVRFDQQGRPVPLVFESAAMPVAMRRGRDGAAEFLASQGCSDRGDWISVKASVNTRAVGGRLEELRSAEFGCRAMQRNNDWLAFDGNRVVRLPDLCADSPGESMRISGRWAQGWPSRVVLDGEDGRDVYLRDTWLGLRRAFGEGLTVRFDGEELWASGRAEPRGVEVEMHVTAMRRLAGAVSEPTEHRLDAERNAIHTAHSAFGVTQRHTTEYEAPEPGARLVSLEASHGLTQWRSASGPFFALHDDGRLREPRVAVPVPGQLVPGEDGPIFQQEGHAFAVRGYLRWLLAR